MTRNQIEYWKNVESQRANQAQEIENNRANLEREKIERERIQSNERIEKKKLDQSLLQLQVNRALSLANLNEQQRANIARERENTATRVQSGYFQTQDQAIRKNQVSLQSLANQETVRANQAREMLTRFSNLETVRANQQNESERYRSNLANEALKYATVQQSQQQIIETKRSNMARESLSRMQTAVSAGTNILSSLARIMSTLPKIGGK